MSQKVYFFAVRPSVGDDCLSARAVVISTSAQSALKALRKAHLKVLNKEPTYITADISLFEDFPETTILWQMNDEEEWHSLESRSQ